MKVKFYGTRGSIPVSGPDKVEYGGNTTSIQVISDCLPPGWALAVDSGSGFVPFAYDCLNNGIKNIVILYTHYHHDHTMGLTKMIPFDRGEKYSLEECLVIKMHKSNHPERTISYRFEERSSGRVFVFLTDHENQDGKPNRFMQHVHEADLLVMDSQYDRKRYDTMTAGYGHGTPDYCVETALQAKVSVLGLTHHDPNSSDAKIEEIVAEAERVLASMEQPAAALKIFACKDYQETEV